MPVRGSCNVTAMCLRATMFVNQYDDPKVSLRRPHRNGDLDIVRALYTRGKANVTEALIVVIEAPVMSRKINTMSFNTMVIEMIG